MTEKRGYRSVILALTLMTASATGSEQVTFIAADGTPIEAEIDYLMIAGDSAGFPPDSPENRVIPNTTDTPFAGVGSLQLFSPEFGHSMCTATPITPRHILTAAHCAARVPMCGMLFILNFGADRSHLIRISAITLHPDTNRARLSVFDDLAVLTLSEPLPPELPIYPIFPDRLFSGDTVTMVGYGWPGDGVTGFRFPGNSDPTIKRWGANVVDTVLLDDEGRGIPEVFLSDFDAPDGTDGRLGGPSLGNDIEGMPGFGDSGGPLFVFDDGRWQVAGLISIAVRFSDPPGPRFPFFGSGMGGVMLWPYRGWLEQFDPARADSEGPQRLDTVNVELQPISHIVEIGDVFDVGLFAVSTVGPPVRIRTADVILTWDPQVLRLVDEIPLRPSPWQGAGFLLGDTSGINESIPPQDGTGRWVAEASDRFPVVATVRGARMATFRFRVVGPGRRSLITVASSGGRPLTFTSLTGVARERRELVACLGQATVNVGNATSLTPAMPPVLLSVDPKPGTIDPRSPVDPEANPRANKITLTFDQIVFDANGARVSDTTFSLEISNANPDLHGDVRVARVETVENPLIRIVLTEPMPIGERMRLVGHVENGAGHETTITLEFANLPLDINRDGVVDVRDATAFGVEWAARDPRLDRIDLDRDGLITVRDATQFGILWRGDDGFPAFRNRRLGTLIP